MGITYGNKSIKIYTKTKHYKVNKTYVPKMYGVIEGPIHLIMREYPNEFSFIRHESKRSLRAPRGTKSDE